MATKTKKTAKTEPKATSAKKPRVNRWKKPPETQAAPETATTTEEAAPVTKPEYGDTAFCSLRLQNRSGFA